MVRPKKECTAFSIRMQQDIFDRLEAYCLESGQSKTVAVERAVAMYVDDYEKRKKIIETVEPVMND